MRPEKIQYIKAYVREIRKYSNLPKVTARDDLLKLIQSLNGVVQFNTDIRTEIELYVSANERFTLVVKPTSLSSKDTFTIAYGIGILFLQARYLNPGQLHLGQIIRKDIGFGQEDLEAKRFAYELLFEEHTFIRACREAYNKLTQEVNLRAVSRKLNISPRLIHDYAVTIGLINETDSEC